MAIALKNIQRKGWINKLGLKSVESVADHSYVMTVMSMIISDLHGYDSKKIMKMTLLHDLAESQVGDFTPEEISKEQKNEIENTAMEKILEHLPSNLKEEYNEIWNEFQSNSSKESIIVHDIDRLEMAFQAIEYFNAGHSKNNIQSFIDTASNQIKNKEIKKILITLLQSQKHNVDSNKS
jgi:putative hydrolase of HD superfamily